MLITMVGPNSFAKQREVRKLFSGKKYVILYGEDGLPSWFELVGQSDLFGETSAIMAHRLVEDLSKTDQQTLADYLSSQLVTESEQQVVVSVENEKQLSSSPLGTLLTQGKVMKFPQPTLVQLGIWLQMEAKNMGIEIEKPSAALMVEKFGGDQFALKAELERWSLLPEKIIHKNDVEKMLPLVTDVSNFDLTNSLSRKDLTKAIDQLSSLRLQGVPDQMIIGSLAWKLESMLVDCLKSNRNGLWTREEIGRAIESLYQLDLSAKKGEAEYEHGLEMWLVEALGVR